MSTAGARAVGMRTDYCGDLRNEDIGRTVSVCGWVHRRREHGEHLAFVDVRDRSGLVQCVVDGAADLRSEYVLRVTGVVRERPEGTRNPNLATGSVELGECVVEVLSVADTPPFGLGDREEADENLRLRYRFVDLRRERMQRNLRMRARVNSAIRSGMERQGFVEVETPLLWTPTPEGAREFVVPSRLQPGSFYVLPQSPQIAKQLLMVGGFDRYYQIARCMRDEDLRADRQFEFTQLDLEASFVGQSDILNFVSEVVLDAAEAATGERPGEIATMDWSTAMERFGTDKPDLRFGLELVEMTEVFSTTEFKAFMAPCIKAIRVPGQAGLSRSRLDALTDRAKELGAKGLVWMRCVPGEAPGNAPGDAARALTLDSPVARFLSSTEIDGILDATQAEPGDLVLVVAGERANTQQVLGQLRIDLGRPAVGEGPYRYVWVVEFPLFDGRDEQGRPRSAHHPFTMPHPDDLELIDSDPLAVRSQAYDLVLNGWELGSGSIRIHRPDIQSQVFDALGISPAEAEERFGFLLGALRFGAPPHGGFAFGIDRLAAIFAGEENIREVIAYPKTQSGVDPMSGAPKTVEPSVLRDLGLEMVGREVGTDPRHGPRST